ERKRRGQCRAHPCCAQLAFPPLKSLRSSVARRATSLVSSFAAERRPGSSSKSFAHDKSRRLFLRLTRAAGGSDCALRNCFFDRDQCWPLDMHYRCCCGVPRGLGTKAMATATDYRKWAQECLEWARKARNESVREQYADLAHVWLDCAARAELRAGAIAAPEPAPGQKGAG